MEYTYHYNSPLGDITLASDGEALTGLWFDGQKYYAAALSDEHEEKYLPIFRQTAKWLDIYFGGKAPDFTPPLSFGSAAPFRKTVWDILLTIPYGSTMTYKDIAELAAERMGKQSMSAQAAGGAVGHNPISVIVPCHRIIGSDGSLTGYAGGIERKISLLRLEGADIQLPLSFFEENS